MSEGVSQATQPLWNQIQRQHKQQQEQQAQWSELEKNYLQRLADAEARAGQASESERLANENSVELKCRLSSVEAQLVTVRNEHSAALKSLEQKEQEYSGLQDQITRFAPFSFSLVPTEDALNETIRGFD